MQNKLPENWQEKTLGDILDKGSSNLSAKHERRRRVIRGALLFNI